MGGEPRDDSGEVDRLKVRQLRECILEGALNRAERYIHRGGSVLCTSPVVYSCHPLSLFRRRGSRHWCRRSDQANICTEGRYFGSFITQLLLRLKFKTELYSPREISPILKTKFVIRIGYN